LYPTDSSYNAARITWKNLEKIHLDPVESLHPFNIVCIFEVGAAAQISDVKKDGENITRYRTALEAIKKVSEIYSDSSTKAQFRGFAYSDEVFPFKMFDSETGNPIEVSSIHSSTIFVAFSEWIESLIPNHKGKPSNPGEALEIGLDSAEQLESNSLSTIILFFSSGTHTSGGNPVKIAKNKSQHGDFPILCFVPGKNSNHDVMEAIAENSGGLVTKVIDFEDVDNIVDTLLELNRGGYD
jgi:hypothetical protein